MLHGTLANIHDISCVVYRGLLFHPYVFRLIMNYPFDICSILRINPNIPNNLRTFRGVTNSNAIGTPIDPRAIREAEGTVAYLSGVRSVSEYVHSFMSSTNILLSEPPR